MKRLDSSLIAVARGDAPADVVLSNARIVNVFNGEVERGNVAICGGSVAGIGDYREGAQVIDLGGRFLAPGLISGHIHMESSMLEVGEYARAVVPRGTSAVVTDLHEIANVAGIPGMKHVLNRARRLPMDLFLMAPSCVPSAPGLETLGAILDVADIRRVLRWRECVGLGEVMNSHGVIRRDAAMLGKLDEAAGHAIDGHAPGLSGRDLNAYIAAGIRSDHESVALDEAREKLARGMRIMIREGSAEKNLEALLPLVTDRTYRRCMFVVDDRSCGDLLRDGEIDAVVRKAIRLGLDPVRAIQMATINAAEHFRLHRLGAVAPGYRANLIALDDLHDLTVGLVLYHGRVVARDGRPLFTSPRAGHGRLTHSVRAGPVSLSSLRLPASGDTMPVIEVVPDQILTRWREQRAKAAGGEVQPDVEGDVLKLVVIERHQATGNVGVGLVSGFGLKEGAVASSIAHDCHHIVIVGTNDADILAAFQQVERMRGGLAVTAGGEVRASLPLPIAGLLSDRPLEEVVAGLYGVKAAAAALGTTLSAPFATLSFVALPVIPEIRLTDLGLVDVRRSRLIEAAGRPQDA